ncbi:MAG: ABC transporter ATP-binding protein [Anaerolineales bacterium]|nr:ABC transporter ATP-binding protein [Anaerolineales bacterium]
MEQNHNEKIVEFKNVSLEYDYQGDRIHALDGIDLTVRRGEFVAVAGPSGCGKTTLLKLIAGLILPTNGSVEILGEPVHGPTKLVGMAFQNPTLLPWRKTLDNVLLPLEIVQPIKSQYYKNRKPYVEKARRLLETVHLNGFDDKQPWQLSGGMQQRVSLCRALIHEPDILLLDEPFGALDAFTREELWLVLQDLWMQQECTVILVTHDLREAIFLANTVYIMSNRPGKLVSQSKVAIPRPRTLEDCFTQEFTDLFHEIRHQIGIVRGEIIEEN